MSSDLKSTTASPKSGLILTDAELLEAEYHIAAMASDSFSPPPGQDVDTRDMLSAGGCHMLSPVVTRRMSYDGSDRTDLPKRRASRRHSQRSDSVADFALNVLPQMHHERGFYLNDVPQKRKQSMFLQTSVGKRLLGEANPKAVEHTASDRQRSKSIVESRTAEDGLLHGAKRRGRSSSFALNHVSAHSVPRSLQHHRTNGPIPALHDEEGHSSGDDSSESSSSSSSRSHGSNSATEKRRTLQFQTHEDTESSESSEWQDETAHQPKPPKMLRRFSRNFTRHVCDQERVSAEVEEGDETSLPWIFTTQANLFFGSMILLNAVYTGIETDYDTDVPKMFWLCCESVFLMIFGVELLLRHRYHIWMPKQADEEHVAFFRHTWNVLDLVIVLAGVIDAWLLTLIVQVIIGIDEDQGGGFVGIFAVLRIFRVLRLLRILRLFRFLRELLLLAQGIYGAMKALGWSIVLVFMTLYTCSIITTRLIGRDAGGLDTDEYIQEMFGSVYRSLFTLFQLMTLEGWADVARECARGQPAIKQVLWHGVFIVFVMFTNLVLLNLVTGVILENVLSISRREEEKALQKEEAHRIKIVMKIHSLFDAVLGDLHSGDLSLDEFRRACTNSNVIRQLHDLQIAQYEAEELFVLMDTSKRGYINIDHFIEGCLRIRGVARAKHLLGVQYDVQKVWSKLSLQLDEVEDRLTNEIERTADLVQARHANDCRDKAPTPLRRSNSNKTPPRRNSRKHSKTSNASGLSRSNSYGLRGKDTTDSGKKRGSPDNSLTLPVNLSEELAAKINSARKSDTGDESFVAKSVSRLMALHQEEELLQRRLQKISQQREAELSMLHRSLGTPRMEVRSNRNSILSDLAAMDAGTDSRSPILAQGRRPSMGLGLMDTVESSWATDRPRRRSAGDASRPISDERASAVSSAVLSGIWPDGGGPAAKTASRGSAVGCERCRIY